jgi:arylsulfatase A-like enzyme
MKTRLRIAALVAVTLAVSTASSFAQAKKPNILVIFGDDIGQTNVSAYSMGMMGYRTPNIDRIANEGMIFTDYYAEQSCTAGRSSFISGQCTLRTGLSGSAADSNSPSLFLALGRAELPQIERK